MEDSDIPEDEEETNQEEPQRMEKTTGESGRGSWTKSMDGPAVLGPGENLPRGPPGSPHIHDQRQVSHPKSTLKPQLMGPPHGEDKFQRHEAGATRLQERDSGGLENADILESEEEMVGTDVEEGARLAVSVRS